VLDFPTGQFAQNLSGVSLPFVPARHAVNPDCAVASILDPFGTITAVDPPPATTCPFLTGMQCVASVSG
jgi:hypothetical protein